MSKPGQYSKPKAQRLAILTKRALYKARDVWSTDMRRVAKDAEDMKYLLEHSRLDAACGYLTHIHVARRDPLRFFITHTGEVVINPVILQASKERIMGEERCIYEDTVHPLERHSWIEVQYVQFIDLLTPNVARRKKIHTNEARHWLHAIDHLGALSVETQARIQDTLHTYFPKTFSLHDYE